MEGIKESVVGFFYDQKESWGSSALFFITGFLCLMVLVRGARNRRR